LIWRAAGQVVRTNRSGRRRMIFFRPPFYGGPLLAISGEFRKLCLPFFTRFAMSKEQSNLLLPFLEPIDPDRCDLFLWLREFAWDLCPDTNELIYDNYNAF